MTTLDMFATQDIPRALPKGWRWVRLGDFVSSYRNGFGRRPKGIEEGPIVLRLADVSTGRVDLSMPRRVAMTNEELATYQVEANDLLFVRVNGSSDLVGRCIFVDINRDDLVFNDHLIRVRLDKGLLPEFVGLVCGLSDVRAHIVEHASTSAGQLTINQEAIGSIQIPLPPLPEQRRIAAILAEQLAAVERARAAAAARLAAAQALPAAYLRAVFDSDEARGWEIKRLGEIALLKNGINFTSDQKGRGLLTVDVLNMYSDGVNVQLDNLYRVDIQPNNEYMLQQNDILFVRSSVKKEGVAWPALFPGHNEPVSFCGFLIRSRLITDSVHPNFLIHYLRTPSVRNELISKSGTGTITNISQGNLETLAIPFPSLLTQKRIADKLASQFVTTDNARAALEAQLAAIDALPAALLRRAFNGEL